MRYHLSWKGGGRADADRSYIRFPDEVTVDDVADESEGTGTNTPAGEPSDDFFTSWDKPSIKRPSNPPSRTGTPGINRTASPFLSANGSNGAAARPKSPLKTADTATPESTTATAQPTATRAISSSAVRKTATTSKPKPNILGAKKTKLGAKKVDSSALDFDEAEKKAREEAERKERLGYDPDEATPAENTIQASQPATTTTTLHQPTPVSPGKAGSFGATGGSRQRSDSEMERLGMGVRRLGFGQVIGGGAPKSASGSGDAAPARGLGFGAVSKPVVQGIAISAAFPSNSDRLLTIASYRRIRTLRPREIRHPKRHIFRRILRPQGIRSQRSIRGTWATSRLRRRYLHFLERLLWTARRRSRCTRVQWQLRRRGQGLCSKIRNHGR